jgi:RNA polymerase sigma factor (sigma-70 family)
MDAWIAKLRQGEPEVAWDLFIDRYRRLIIAAIRHYVQDYDDVMDVFAHVCEALREEDLRRLRRYEDQHTHSARFSTWLVTVVRNLTIDWLRHRGGRRRVPSCVEQLPPLRRRIFEYVFFRKRSHVETYELLRTAEGLDLPFGKYLTEVAATYRAVAEGRGIHPLPESSGGPSLEPSVDPPATSDIRETLGGILEGLPPEDRAAVELYVVEELPAEDVARIVGLPNAKAVYNRVYRALATLRERLERAGIGPEDL